MSEIMWYLSRVKRLLDLALHLRLGFRQTGMRVDGRKKNPLCKSISTSTDESAFDFKSWELSPSSRSGTAYEF